MPLFQTVRALFTADSYIKYQSRSEKIDWTDSTKCYKKSSLTVPGQWDIIEQKR